MTNCELCGAPCYPTLRLGAQGKPVITCASSECADSFRTDRHYGLIYGSVRDVDTNQVFDWGASSIYFKFCAYCKEGW